MAADVGQPARGSLRSVDKAPATLFGYIVLWPMCYKSMYHSHRFDHYIIVGRWSTRPPISATRLMRVMSRLHCTSIAVSVFILLSVQKLLRTWREHSPSGADGFNTHYFSTKPAIQGIARQCTGTIGAALERLQQLCASLEERKPQTKRKRRSIMTQSGKVMLLVGD